MLKANTAPNSILGSRSLFWYFQIRWTALAAAGTLHNFGNLDLHQGLHVVSRATPSITTINMLYTIPRLYYTQTPPLCEGWGLGHGPWGRCGWSLRHVMHDHPRSTSSTGVSARMATSKVHRFVFPEIHENPTGWGPCEVPEQFKDTPYQPFSKGDHLGKVNSCWMAGTWLLLVELFLGCRLVW